MPASFPFYHIGHFVNQPGDNLPYALVEFGAMAAPEVDDVHKHTFYEIIWVSGGHSTQVIDYRTYTLGPGMLFFISPGQVHHFEEWQQLQGCSIFFTREFFVLGRAAQDSLLGLSFLDNVFAQPYLMPAPPHAEAINQCLALMRAEEQGAENGQAPSNPPSNKVRQALLHLLVALIERAFSGERADQPPQRSVVIYKQLQALLEEHFRQQQPPSFYAEQLNITAHHLNLVMRQVTGHTTSAVIRRRTMLEAQRLLTFTEAPVAEIAAELGLFDGSHFARQFRAELGASPQAFRRAMSDAYRKSS
jgi:AraC family transcriptional regulator, transcriptional activator of pobA